MDGEADACFCCFCTKFHPERLLNVGAIESRNDQMLCCSEELTLNLTFTVDALGS